MKKKLILLVALLLDISVVAMDHTKEMIPGKEAPRKEEETLMKICFTDSASSNSPHTLEIPVRLAKLVGTLNELVEDPKTKDSVFPLPRMTFVEWQLIEAQLERVYSITHDASQAAPLRQEITTEFGKLDAKSLIELIHALDYADIQLLLEIACDELKQRDLGRFNFEEINSLPEDMGNRIILDKILASCGPMPARELAVCRGHENLVRSVSVTHHGKIVSWSNDKTVRVWDMHGNQLAICRGHEDLVRSVRVVADGDMIVSGSHDGTVRVWDMQGKSLAICRGHEGLIYSVCVTNDGKIVSGSHDKTVRMWDMQGNHLALCRGHEGMVWSVCVSVNGKIVSGSTDKTVRVWDMQGNQLAQCRGHEDMIWSVCVTSDGNIVSGSADQTVRVWDMQGKELAICRGHGYGVVSVRVTNNGKIVSGSDDDTVRVWDMQGKKLAVCRGHEDGVSSVCVTKDGTIVSGSCDNTVRVWNMEGKELALCRGHEHSVKSVCVTKDGKIVSVSSDKTVRVWDISLLNRIRCMDEDKARAVWELLHNISKKAEIDKQQLWKEVEKILGDDAQMAHAIVNNNNE